VTAPRRSASPELAAAAGQPWHVETPGRPAVQGFLHRPAAAGRDGLVLAHGAGSDASAPLLVALASALAGAGVAVLRMDLPFRQSRRTGPPSPAGAARDREGLREALRALRAIAPGRVFLGGLSYGGRQASMLLAEEPGLADGLLLLSYPLHPPGRPGDLRTAHLPRLRTPALFAHGTADPFGSPAEMEAARALVPGRAALVLVEGAGHALGQGRRAAPAGTVATVARAFLEFVGAPVNG
jgi:predicted alpha/beta-hydrolase family hydrolase